MGNASRPADIRRRRFGASARAALAVALAAGALVAANALSARVYAHWRADSAAGLSDRTLETLRGARGVIEAVAVFDRGNGFRDAARELLEEFAEAAAAMPDLSFRYRAIDANRDLAEAAEAFREHPELVANSILFRYGDRTRVVDEWEMSGEGDGRFFGERACASALLRLVHPAAAAVYFLSGHGEYDPRDRHPVTGASSLGHALASNGFEARTLAFGPRDAAVPPDCRVLVAAGPRTVLPQRDRELLADFLADGGRLLLLADDANAAGLGPLLELWGLRLDPRGGGGRSSSSRRSALTYADHPATRRMRGVMSVFVSPCGVSATPPSDAAAQPPRVTPLVTADAPDAGAPLCVAAVSEAARSPRGDTRLAVFGDSDFVSNALLDGGMEGNARLFLSVVDWLGDSGRPVVPGENGAAFEPGVGTDEGWRRLALVLALGLPACILVFGVLLYVPFARRR